eukprot:1377338-Amphidinium_carterae.1
MTTWCQACSAQFATRALCLSHVRRTRVCANIYYEEQTSMDDEEFLVPMSIWLAAREKALLATHLDAWHQAGRLESLALVALRPVGVTLSLSRSYAIEWRGAPQSAKKSLQRAVHFCHYYVQEESPLATRCPYPELQNEGHQVPLNMRSTVELIINMVSLISSGEAHGVIKMGGSVTLSTLNVGCLSAKVEGVANLPTDFCALQEVGLLFENTPSADRLAKSCGIQLSLGPCPSAAKDNLGRKNHNKSLGVGMTCKAGCGLARIDVDFPSSSCPLSRLSSFLLVKDDWDWRCPLAIKHEMQQIIASDFQGPPYEYLRFRQLFAQGWLSAACVGGIPFSHTSGPDCTSVCLNYLLPLHSSANSSTSRRRHSAQLSGSGGARL